MASRAEVRTPDGGVRTIGPAASSPELGARAHAVVSWMGRVKRAEAVYARYHIDLSRDGASLWRTVTARRRRHEAALAFDELVAAVRGLRSSWELFCLRALTEQLTSRAALRLTLPGLFDSRGSRRDLRDDTTFSYTAARTAGDIATLFSRRLELGYC